MKDTVNEITVELGKIIKKNLKSNIMKTLVRLLTVLGLITLTSCKQDTNVNRMMHHNGDFHPWGMHMGWWVTGLLIVIVLIMIFLYLKTKRTDSVKWKSPLEILDRRYAKGEITKEQYEEQKRTIKSKN